MRWLSVTKWASNLQKVYVCLGNEECGVLIPGTPPITGSYSMKHHLHLPKSCPAASDTHVPSADLAQGQ